MVGYIILGIILAAMISWLISTLKTTKKHYLDCHRSITKDYSWCSAIVSVDKKIPLENGVFRIGGKSISESQLTLACAGSMKAVNFYANKHKILKSKGNLKKSSFLFLTDEEYDKIAKEHSFVNTNSFSILTDNYAYSCYIRAKNMTNVSVSGQLAVHEFLHCFLHKTTGHWDTDHSANKIVLEKGRNMEQLACNAVTIIIVNQFGLRKN